MEVSIVIPVRNEAGNIAPLVREIGAALDGLLDFEIVYVDDGSEDGTIAEIRGLQPAEARLRVVRHRESCGQSAAIRTGVKAARGVWIATLDGDGQNDPADIPALWRIAQDAPASLPLLIAGHRRHRQDSWTKRRASRIANGVRRRLLRDDTPDTGCGLKLFRRDLFLDLPYFDHMHRFLPALVLRAGGTVRSVPVNHRPRQRGRSKYGILDRLGVGVVDLLGVIWLRRRSSRPVLIEEHIAGAGGASAEPQAAPANRSGALMRRLRVNPVRLATLGLLALGIAAAWRWRGLLDPAALSAAIEANPAAPLVFIGLHIAASLFFVPRTLLALVAGLAFGAWWGVVWAALGSVLGAIAGFLVARYIRAGLLDHAANARLAALLARAERGGWRVVAVLRLVPVIPHSLTNYALGLTRLRLGSYALGSLLGQLPLTIAYVDLGAAGGRVLVGGADWMVPSAIGAAVLCLSLLIPLLARRFRLVEPVPEA